jgi:hypothetical protein
VLNEAQVWPPLIHTKVSGKDGDFSFWDITTEAWVPPGSLFSILTFRSDGLRTVFLIRLCQFDVLLTLLEFIGCSLAFFGRVFFWSFFFFGFSFFGFSFLILLFCFVFLFFFFDFLRRGV